MKDRSVLFMLLRTLSSKDFEGGGIASPTKQDVFYPLHCGIGFCINHRI